MGFWAKLAAQGFETRPTEFIADGDKVAVVTENRLGGEEGRSVDILDYDGSGQLVRFETFGDEEVLDRTFPR